MGAAKVRGTYAARKCEAERRNARRAEQDILTSTSSGPVPDLRPRAIPRGLLGVLAAMALSGGQRPRR